MANQPARKHRLNQTEAEKRLWKELRRKQVEGKRFRRQTPIGPYIVDFFCPEKKLIIELNGGQHAYQRLADAKRTEWLMSNGYRVLRFWNNEVFENLEGVISEITQVLT